MMIRRTLLVLAIGASTAYAQDVDFALRPPRDSVLSVARKMVLGDEADAGRKLVDSVLAASARDDTIHAEALFWRGVLAATAAEAERSYRRLLIEAPLSDRAEEALLQLAQLEASRGNRRSASDHLFRYMVSYGESPDRPARPRISLWLVRLLFEQPDQPSKQCAAVRMSQGAIPPENIELRNQLESFVTRCAYAQVETPAAPPADTAAAPAPDTVRAESKAKTTPAGETKPGRPKPAPTKASPTGQFYSVQVAAYDSREAASRMAELLASRGLEARVDGTQRPFRVRIGRFATRAEAVKMQQALRSQGQNGFVTVVTK